MLTPRCSACRLPYKPAPGAKNRRCPGCQREKQAKAKVKVRTPSLEDRLAAEREQRMLSRGRLVGGAED